MCRIEFWMVLPLIQTTATHRFYIHNVISKQRKKGMSTYVFRIQFRKRCPTLQKVLWSIFFFVKTRTNSCQKENNICLLNSFYKNAPFFQECRPFFVLFVVAQHKLVGRWLQTVCLAECWKVAKTRKSLFAIRGSCLFTISRRRVGEKRASVKVIVFFLTVICSTESSLRPVVL